jgi:cob(I)alamin adenosyltransferase
MGYIHIYTGNGKGKSTAAFGLAIRALMSGKKVYIGQFVKDMAYNETKISNDYENLTIEQLGKGCFIQRKPTDEDKKIARAALDKCYKLYSSDRYDLIILDELCIALYFKLFSVQVVIDYFFSKKHNAEIVITGRYCPEEMIERADLVTEMKEIKHYFNQGVSSRDGFDR